jgi:hypothetical protein
MNETSVVILKEIPSPDGTVIFKGSNAGVNNIIVEINGHLLNIIDFLNQSLKAAYTDACDDILAKYKNKMQTADLSEYDYPKLTYTPALIDKAFYEIEAYPGDEAVLKALIAEYSAAVKDMTNHMARWTTLMEEWYSRQS